MSKKNQALDFTTLFSLAVIATGGRAEFVPLAFASFIKASEAPNHGPGRRQNFEYKPKLSGRSPNR